MTIEQQVSADSHTLPVLPFQYGVTAPGEPSRVRRIQPPVSRKWFRCRNIGEDGSNQTNATAAGIVIVYARREPGSCARCTIESHAWFDA